jgi:EAL domain-containing protein (putative c-di-GMP-specific phosphodiesterase class I)/GGDEF domain-containing protein
MDVMEGAQKAIARFRPGGVCASAFAYAALASVAPLLALFYVSASAEAPAVLTAVALAITLLGLAGLARALKPVTVLAAMLDRQASDMAGSPAGRGGDHRQMVANFQLITARLEALNRQPLPHPVTGLPARDAFMAMVSNDLAFNAAPSLMGLIRFANYDQLAGFNPEGADRVLNALARRLTASVGGRPIAQVDRDCFAIWFGASADAKAAHAELEALGYVLIRDVEEENAVVTPDIQLGAALYPLDAEEPSALLNRAFVSLARPQRTADGGISFFARPSPEASKRRFSLEQRLRGAVRRGELHLQYQPIVDLAMGRVLGAEALMRWTNGSHGAVSPAQIVPVLEETGLVHEVGLWTINAACRQLRDWAAQGHGDLKVAVNLSACQLRDSALVSVLKRTIAAHGLKACQLELELTETAAMEDAARTQVMFEQLREAGFGLAIDDFGSGYSSLTYLRRLPFQKLKIDREFVSYIDQRADSRTICKALIELTAGLELGVLAEGVERYEEVEILHALGCSTFQGYYFAKPLSGDEFIETTTNREWLARLNSRVHRQQDEVRRRLS